MAIINRSAAEALIQEQIVSEIFQKPVQESTFLRLARRMPDMTSNQTRIRVLDTLPMAYWVSGEALSRPPNRRGTTYISTPRNWRLSSPSPKLCLTMRPSTSWRR